MALTAQDVFARDVRDLPPAERLRLASLILQELTQSGLAIVQQSESWTEQDQHDITAFSLEHANRIYPEDEDLVYAGDVVVIDFPGVAGTKRRPAVVLSSAVYHAARPDVIVGLITSRSVPAGPTDYPLRDSAAAGLRLPSTFRSFLVTLPPAAHPVVVGRQSDRDWDGVRACVKAALAAL